MVYLLLHSRAGVRAALFYAVVVLARMAGARRPRCGFPTRAGPTIEAFHLPSTSTLNTLVISVGASGICSCTIVAYGFARLTAPGKGSSCAAALHADAALSGHDGAIALFNQLGWIDTFLPLIVPAFFGSALLSCCASSSSPCRPSWRTPRTDGANTSRSAPRHSAHFTSGDGGHLHLQASWNDLQLIFLWTSPTTPSPGPQLLPQLQVRWSYLMAASLAVLPVILVFLCPTSVIEGIA